MSYFSYANFFFLKLMIQFPAVTANSRVSGD